MPSFSETPLCRYHYDALDRLIARRVSGEPEYQCFYRRSRLVTEIQGAIRYSIVQNGDQLLAQQRSTGKAIDTTLLTSDQQRSVLHAVNANQRPYSFAYLPYGHHHAVKGLFSQLGFTGERPDPVTGHYLLGNGHRAFNPVLMRFNSPDRLSPFGEKIWNSYAYCVGDPVNLQDPTGLSPIASWTRLRLNLQTATSIMKERNQLGIWVELRKEAVIENFASLVGQRKQLYVDVNSPSSLFNIVKNKLPHLPSTPPIFIKNIGPGYKKLRTHQLFSKLHLPKTIDNSQLKLTREREYNTLNNLAIRDQLGNITDFHWGDAIRDIYDDLYKGHKYEISSKHKDRIDERLYKIRRDANIRRQKFFCDYDGNRGPNFEYEG